MFFDNWAHVLSAENSGPFYLRRKANIAAKMGLYSPFWEVAGNEFTG